MRGNIFEHGKLGRMLVRERLFVGVLKSTIIESLTRV